MLALQDLINWCCAWLDDYYDFYETEEDFTPEIVNSILVQLRDLERIKGVMNYDKLISPKM